MNGNAILTRLTPVVTIVPWLLGVGIEWALVASMSGD